MLLSPLYFWEGSTNTFHLPCGMLTPTLFDVATITGLSPMGETFDPTHSTKIKFSFKCPSLKFYVADHHVKDFNEVSDEEQIAFLTLWLSYYVFCPGSLHIAKSFIPLAIQLHEVRQISLGKLLLASLYHSLGLASLKLKLLQSTPKYLNMSGSLWLLQHWLNATFEYKPGYPVLERIMHLTNERLIEGVRLALTTC